MKKVEQNNDVFYSVAWSPISRYDKYKANASTPELAGIVAIYGLEKNGSLELLFYLDCWRAGIRSGLRNFLDPSLSFDQTLAETLLSYDLCFSYTVIDSAKSDLQDIYWWYVMQNQPLYNKKNMESSKRYRDIYIKESKLSQYEIKPRHRGWL